MLLSFYFLATAWHPAQYGIIQFFDHLDRGEEEAGWVVLKENLKIAPMTHPSEREALLSFLSSYMNDRYKNGDESLKEKLQDLICRELEEDL